MASVEKLKERTWGPEISPDYLDPSSDPPLSSQPSHLKGAGPELRCSRDSLLSGGYQEEGWISDEGSKVNIGQMKGVSFAQTPGVRRL